MIKQYIKTGDTLRENTAWIKTSEQKPKLYSNVEYSDDGIEVEGTMDYTDQRICMMAGIAGGHGYFSNDGFATDHASGTDVGLICDDPKYWRYWEDLPTLHIPAEDLKNWVDKEVYLEGEDFKVVWKQPRWLDKSTGPAIQTAIYIGKDKQPESVEEFPKLYTTSEAMEIAEKYAQQQVTAIVNPLVEALELLNSKVDAYWNAYPKTDYEVKGITYAQREAKQALDNYKKLKK